MKLTFSVKVDFGMCASAPGAVITCIQVMICGPKSLIPKSHRLCFGGELSAVWLAGVRLRLLIQFNTQFLMFGNLCNYFCLVYLVHGGWANGQVWPSLSSARFNSRPNAALSPSEPFSSPSEPFSLVWKLFVSNWVS